MSCHLSELSVIVLARNGALHGYQNSDPHPSSFMQNRQDSSLRKKPQDKFIVQNMILIQ